MNRHRSMTLILLALVWICGNVLEIGMTSAALAATVQDHLRDRIKAMPAPSQLSLAGESLYVPEMLTVFYGQRFYQPAWSDTTGPSPLADALIDALYSIEREGLDPYAYHLVAIETVLVEVQQHQETSTPLDPAQLADLDLLLSDAFLTVGTHLAPGQLAGQTVATPSSIPQVGVNFVRLLQHALDNRLIADALHSLLPSQSGYARLRQALESYRHIAANEDWPLVPDGPTLRQGDRSERIVALRMRLQTTDDFIQPSLRESPLRDELPADSDVIFDEELEQAVRAFQSRHGLQVDGIVGPVTLATLNVPVETRIRQIALNLERWRRSAPELGDQYILVNIPAFTLDVIEHDRSVKTMRVVVGKPYQRTPLFQSTMTHLVLSPYWQIPRNIARREILPQLRQDPEYLAKHNMKVIDGQGAEAHVIEPSTIDWSAVTAENFPYRLRQEPGTKNALGRIKFKFPNRFNVYLHDTPARSLFAKPSRAFSHGCIRVEKPVELASYLLQNDPKWSQKRILATIARGVVRWINLAEPIPVHTVYRTVWADANGAVQFRPDIYRHDKLQEPSFCGIPTRPCG